MTRQIYRAVEDLPVLSRRDADRLADRIIDDLIEALRRDPTMPRRSSAEWDLVLAKLRPRMDERIASMVIGRVDLEEVLVTIEATL
jgi:hypothetical protein